MINESTVKGLGATLIDKKAYVFFCDNADIRQGTFSVHKSKDGLNFKVLGRDAKVININGPSDELDKCNFVHISKNGRYYYLTYKVCNNNSLCIARSKNLIDWEKRRELDIECNSAKIISKYSYNNRSIMITDGKALRLYASKDFDSWKCISKNLIALDSDADKMEIISVQIIDKGIFVVYANIYFEKSKIQRKSSGKIKGDNSVVQYKLYGALFEYKNPTKLLWQSKKPIYETKNKLKDISKLFGAILFNEQFVSYWMNSDGKMFLIRHFYKHEDDLAISKSSDSYQKSDKNVKDFFELDRSDMNPIIKPQNNLSWESHAVYNPTAIEDDGVIHIIYRADGDDMKSAWGYASTKNGVTIDNRSKRCIYHRNSEPVGMKYSKRIIYTSGNNGGGGSEDPRAVLIDDEVYVTFTAFDGWGSVRVALTSISLEDLRNQRCNWKKTRFISPPGEINKNWVIFPEKINGKFAILHSFSPKILIDYFDSLDELDGDTFIYSNNKRPVDYSRTWDSWFRGVGPAPIKTDEGWLIIFHAMDYRNPDRYRLGALLLDLQDPTKEICRSRGPILNPEEHYENDGHKWGVIYSCGAVIKGKYLFVYYGGADKFVCVAKAPIKEFLDELKKTGESKMNIN